MNRQTVALENNSPWYPAHATHGGESPLGIERNTKKRTHLTLFHQSEEPEKKDPKQTALRFQTLPPPLSLSMNRAPAILALPMPAAYLAAVVMTGDQAAVAGAAAGAAAVAAVTPQRVAASHPTHG